jgi:Na+/proline symporter
MMIAVEHLPAAFRGILLAGFLAAYMSTVSTQLNWGTSYLVEDFYRRFVRPQALEAHYVRVSRLMTLVLVAVIGIVAAQLASIREGWTFVLEVGAGTGAVYILRWYWWRINAWSEISAMATALVVSVSIHFAQPFQGPAPIVFAKSALTTTGITTLVWLVVTMLTPAESTAVLTAFYRKVRPHAAGWRPVAALAQDVPPTRDLGRNLGSWLLGCVMVYSALIGVGKLLLGVHAVGSALVGMAIVSGWLLYGQISRHHAST